jgi:ubiquinone biosynthesis protein
MIRSLRNLLRLFHVARILARHDALFVPSDAGWLALPMAVARLLDRRREPGRPGQRLARALEEAGPTFIKLGQALSCRADLIGEEMAADLSDLQDRLPPFDGAAARRIIEEDLGQPVEALFSHLDPQPVAAASIAQVHLAETTDGRAVAVKVLRPGVKQAVARDLELFLWVAEVLEATVPEARRLKPVQTVQTFADTVTFEMDLRFEAAAASEIADNFRGDRSFRVPAVDWTRTAERVLTTERIIGLPIDEREAIIAAGLIPEKVLAAAARAFFLQVFRDGVFHADLHAGNLFVQADGSVAAVDFGIVGRIDVRNRRFLGELLMAFLNRNYRRAAEVHFAAGWVPADRSIGTFAQACRSIGEPILDKPVHEISIAQLLGQLFRVTATFGMETQPDLLLLQKSMLVAEGTSRALCPEANFWMLARPLIEDWIAETMGPEAQLREAARAVREALVHMPETVRRLDKASRALAASAPSPSATPDRRSGGEAAVIWLLSAAVIVLMVLHILD